MAEKPQESNANHSSSWWGFAQSAWTVIQDTAKDFQESIVNENEETIQNIKQNINQQQITNKLTNATNSINTFLNTTIDTINKNVTSTTNNNKQNNNKINIKSSPKEQQIIPKLKCYLKIIYKTFIFIT